MPSHRFVRALAAVGAATIVSFVHAQNYRLVELKPLPGGQGSQARAINELGHVSGGASVAGEDGYPHAVYWPVGDAIDIIGTGFSVSLGFGLNDVGDVVGVTEVFGSNAFLYRDGEVMPLEPVTLFSNANAINNLGHAVGYSTVSGGAHHAILWETPEPQDLGTLGGSSSEAFDINDAGAITGHATDADGQVHACVWIDGQVQSIGHFGGVYATGESINARGVVVGQATLPQGAPDFGATRAFMWDGGEMIDLGTLGGFAASAHAINDLGQIVGFSYDGEGGSGGFLVHEGVMLNLNDRLVAVPDDVESAFIGHAYDINNSGQIAASGTVHGMQRALRLDPVLDGDANLDGIVDALDLALVLGTWGSCGDDDLCPTDFDRDGIVGPFDLAILLAAWS